MGKGKVYGQVYSLIRQERAGLLEALKVFAGLGYDGVELISSFTDGLDPAEFRKYVADLGLDVVSVMGLKSYEELAFGQAMGARFTVANISGHPKAREELLAIAETLNATGRNTARFGLKTLYHNHANEFIQIGDTCAYDILIQNTDPALVGFEFDVGWGQLSGTDCAAVVRRYPGRFPIIHVKECNKVAAFEDEYEHFPPRIMALAKSLAGDVRKVEARRSSRRRPRRSCTTRATGTWSSARA
jgi:sugar phosphate isomerase/epimerase